MSTAALAITKEEVISHLYDASSCWTKDAALPIPRAPESIPVVSLKVNTHRGKHFTVFEGIPRLSEDCLWLAAEIELPQNASAFPSELFSAMLAFMVSQMKKCLAHYQPTRIHPNLYMKKPSNDKLYLALAVRMA